MFTREQFDSGSDNPQATIAGGERTRQSTRSPADSAPVIDLAAHGEARDGQQTEPHSFAWDLRYIWQNVRTALPLVVCDQLVLVGALSLAMWGIQWFGVTHAVSASALGLSLGCGLFLAFIIARLYPGVGLPPDEEVHQCTVSTSLVFVVFLSAARLYAPKMETTVVIIAAWLICLATIPFARFCTRRVFGRFRWWLQPVVVFGHGPESRSLLKTLTSSPHLGLTPIGILDDLHSHWNADGDDAAEFLGHPDAAPDISRRHGVYRAIVAMPERSNSQVHHILAASSDWFPHLLVIQKKQGLPLLCTKGWDLGWHSGVQLTSRLLLPIPRLTKRVVDLTVASAGVVFLTPLMLLIAAAIKCASPGPVFYGQNRIGRFGRPFRAWKFRTMVAGAEHLLTEHLERHPELQEQWDKGCKLKDDPRVIPWIGYLLRRCSLDELPQLWNVLAGEMSLVGPRPLPQYHLDEFDEDFRCYREKITPGMTGLWQVTGRTDTCDAQMFVKWDTYYIRNWSLWLDLQILFRTPKTVIEGKGAY